MKLTLRTLRDAAEPLQRLLGTPLPATAAFKMKRVFRLIAPEVNDLEQQRVEMVKRYGAQKGEDNWEVLPENKELFMQEFDALLDTAVDLDLPVLAEDSLGNVVIAPADLIFLDFLFEASAPSDSAQKPQKSTRPRKPRPKAKR